jgi:hypothetical protein
MVEKNQIVLCNLTKFVDQLCDDRLTLGNLAALAVDRRRHRLVERLGQQRPQVCGSGTRGLPDCPFLNRVCTGGLLRPTG